MKRAFENILSIFLFVLGLSLLFSAGVSMTGAAIGAQGQSAASYLFYGIIFLSVSLVIFLMKAETRKIRNTIDDLVSVGVPKEQLEEIQLKIRKEYSRYNKEVRKEIYEETADILERVKKGARRGTAYELHDFDAPRGLPHAPDRILEGYAKKINQAIGQRGAGTDRYIFNNRNGDFLGVAFHPHGNARDLRWRWRIRY